MGLMMFLLGFFWLHEYREHGYINTAKYGFVPTHGSLAAFICYLFLVVGGFLIFWGGKQLFYKEKPNQSLEADD